MADTEAPSRSPLFRWRTNLHLTQREAADRLGLPTNTYSLYERDMVMPRADALAQIGAKSGDQNLPTACVLYHYRGTINREAAECYFRQTTGQS